MPERSQFQQQNEGFPFEVEVVPSHLPRRVAVLSEARERNPQEGRSRLRRKRTGHGAAPKLWEQLTPFTFRALLRLCPALRILIHLTVL